MTTVKKIDIEKELIAIALQLMQESGHQYKREVRLDASLQRHLGIDSLGRAEFFQRVERGFNVTVPDRLLAEAETLKDIADYLEHANPKIIEPRHKKIITSHGEHVHVDLSDAKSLIDVLYLYAERAPNKPHIYFQDEDGQDEMLTYGQLLERSLQVAAGLRERGIQNGETVAIMQPTSLKFFYTFFGTLLAGGVPVPIYPPFRAHMLESYARTEAKILSNAEVRILVTFDQAETLSRLLKAFVPSLKDVTTVDELMQPKGLKNVFHAKSDSFAFIQYTSGSTSDPKGVLLSHYNLISNIQGYGKAIKVKPDDVAVSWLPLYHDMGLIGMWLGSLYHGVPLVLMTPFSFLNRPERWLWAIHNHRGTLSGAPNFAYELCVRKIDHALIEGLDLSSWRMAANGAEKVYPRTLEQFAQKFAPYGFNAKAILPVYGLAESAVGLAIPEPGKGFVVDHVDRKKFEEQRICEPSQDKNALAFVCCGPAIEDHEMRIVDDNNRMLPERHVGRLQFRGPSRMQGYYNNPTATAAVYHDGWVDTGDLAYLVNDEVYITGRRKDLIIKAGRNLYPAEIEELVGNVAGVRQGCVTAFGVTDQQRGTEQLIVVAETREKNKSKRERLIADINEKISIALDILPDQVVLVAPRTVPKTSSGKLQRAACKNMFIEGRLDKFHIPAWMQVARLGLQWIGRNIWKGITLCFKSIYTLYVSLVLAISFLPLYLIVHFGQRDTAAKTCRVWSRMMLRMMFCPLKIVGSENLQSGNPIIYAANHASYTDAVVLMSVLPPNTRFVGKKELFSTPIFRTFMQKLDYLAVDRMDMPKGIEDTAKMEQSLTAGNAIVIFPEGTFGYAAGLRPFRMGAFKIAADTNIPICPIALAGTRKILRDNEKLMRPALVTVTIGQPIAPFGKEWQDLTKLRDTVRAAIAPHCGEPSLDFIAAQTVAPRMPKTG